MESLNQIWEQVLEIVKHSGMSQSAFDVWISPLEPRDIEDGELVIMVNTSWQKKTVTEMYAPLLQKTLEQVIGFPLGVRVMMKEEVAADVPVVTPAAIEGNGFPSNVEDEYTFENFVKGSSNEFALAAARAVANSPAVHYNPLFIHGGSGLGKTHLMCAICKEILRKNPATRILYTKGETMTIELIEAIENGTTADFRAKYRQVDVLLVDDIQFIAGKKSTQEEFFHTFDALHSNNKQIVLTSDRPPREIATLEERLQSRFEMGLLADVQAPDLETRIAIIRRKAKSLDLPLQDDVAEYIAGQLKSNVRQLEGVVKRMSAQYMLIGEQPNLISAQNAIRDIRNDNQPTPVTVERIINEVARTMNVKPEDIRSKNNSAPISKARQVAAFAVRKITGLTTKSIGKEFGDRDHSTIVYAIQKVEQQMATDTTYKNMINDIIRNVSENA